jgi:hypothetical protein
MSALANVAPALQIERWLNTEQPITLESLRGKVVVLEAFQMLCPGCVSHGLPQAMRVRATFPSGRVAVVGLHTVFEHHEAMTAVASGARVAAAPTRRVWRWNRPARTPHAWCRSVTASCGRSASPIILAMTTKATSLARTSLSIKSMAND